MRTNTLEKVTVIKSKPIRILSDLVVNQIAAGEVIERPASVVKELIENSLDAGSTKITVLIEGGGKSSIEVRDNGWGMDSGNARLALERFGTSKIEEASDLESISTLGFRGEALASIASVSKFTLRTSAGIGDPATEIVVEGGRKLSDKIHGRSPVAGTTIIIKDLFFNVPARKRFLKTEKTEQATVKNLIVDFSLAYPECHFELYCDGRRVLAYLSSRSLLDRASEINVAGDKHFAINLSQNIDGMGEVSVMGILSDPVFASSSSSRLRLIVNGRIVRDRLLLRAVKDAYGNYLKGMQYPSGVINLVIPNHEVDVNVHPQKTEIRFRSAQRIYAVLTHAIRRGLEERSPVSSTFQVSNIQNANTSLFNIKDGLDFSRQNKIVGWHGDEAGKGKPEVTTFGQVRDPGDSYGTPIAWQLTNNEWRYVGQILDCYLVFENSPSDKFMLMDMHAAHERVKFFQLKSQLTEAEISSQLLLVPELIELSSEMSERFSESAEDMQRLGFDCEIFDEGTLLVRSVPALLGDSSIKDIVTGLLEREWGETEISISQRMDQIIATIACHGSVRSGRKLIAEEAYALLDSLTEAENSAFCPHGRPVIIYYSRQEVEALFGRS